MGTGEGTSNKWLELVQQSLALASEVSKISNASGALPKWLALASAVIGQGVAAWDDLKSLKSLVELMVSEQREPTAEEWATYQMRSDAAHQVIQGYDIEGE